MEKRIKKLNIQHQKKQNVERKFRKILYIKNEDAETLKQYFLEKPEEISNIKSIELLAQELGVSRSVIDRLIQKLCINKLKNSYLSSKLYISYKDAENIKKEYSKNQKKLIEGTRKEDLTGYENDYVIVLKSLPANYWEVDCKRCGGKHQLTHDSIKNNNKRKNCSASKYRTKQKDKEEKKKYGKPRFKEIEIYRENLVGFENDFIKVIEHKEFETWWVVCKGCGERHPQSRTSLKKTVSYNLVGAD